MRNIRSRALAKPMIVRAAIVPIDVAEEGEGLDKVQVAEPGTCCGLEEGDAQGVAAGAGTACHGHCVM